MNQSYITRSRLFLKVAVLMRWKIM